MRKLFFFLRRRIQLPFSLQCNSDRFIPDSQCTSSMSADRLLYIALLGRLVAKRQQPLSKMWTRLSSIGVMSSFFRLDWSEGLADACDVSKCLTHLSNVSTTLGSCCFETVGSCSKDHLQFSYFFCGGEGWWTLFSGKKGISRVDILAVHSHCNHPTPRHCCCNQICSLGHPAAASRRNIGDSKLQRSGNALCVTCCERKS